MSKLRQSARHEQCTINLSVCDWGTETTVLAHAPCEDKGVAFKSPDTWAAYACRACHDALDMRTGWNETEHPAQSWMRGIYRTHKRMRERGLL